MKAMNVHVGIYGLVLVIAFSPLNVLAQVSSDGAEPIGLEKSISKAIVNNFDIYIAQLENKIAFHEIDKELGKYDINLSMGGGYTDNETEKKSSVYSKRNITSELTAGLKKLFPFGALAEVNTRSSRFTEPTSSALSSPISPIYESALDFSVTQPLLKNSFGFIDRAEVKIVKIDVSQADLATLSKIETIIADTYKTYFDLMFAYDFFNAKQEALERATEFLKITEDQLQTGLVEKTDLYAAQANALIKQNDVMSAKDVVLNASNDLKLVTNYYPTTVFVPADTQIAYEVDENLDQHLLIAFEHRRDYQSKQFDMESQDITLKINRQKLWPQLDLEATFLSNGFDEEFSDTLGEMLSNGDDSYFIGGKFSVPLENKEARATLTQSQHQKAIYIAELRKLEKDIQLEIDKNLRKILLENEKYAKYKEVATLQRNKETEESKKFKIGRSSSDLIIRYQNDAIDAKVDERSSYNKYLKAVVDLKKSENILLNEVRLQTT
jgi:outer membrane protein